jgi:large subunit ribosomal protein L28
MSAVCQVTGKRPVTGKSISHSHIRSNRWFRPNIQKKRFFVPSENRFVSLTVSAKGIKIINKRGIESVLADIRKRGEKI